MIEILKMLLDNRAELKSKVKAFGPGKLLSGFRREHKLNRSARSHPKLKKTVLELKTSLRYYELVILKKNKMGFWAFFFNKNSSLLPFCRLEDDQYTFFRF